MDVSNAKVHYCGIVMGRIEAIWTSVDVGEQVYTRLKIRYLCGCVGSSPSPGINFKRA